MAKNQELPGVEGEGVSRVKIKPIEDAAEAYVQIRDKRMAWTDKEVETKKALIDVALKHQDKLPSDENGNRLYRYDDMVVILKPGHPNVRVKHDTGDVEDDLENEED